MDDTITRVAAWGGSNNTHSKPAAAGSAGLNPKRDREIDKVRKMITNKTKKHLPQEGRILTVQSARLGEKQRT